MKFQAYRKRSVACYFFVFVGALDFKFVLVSENEREGKAELVFENSIKKTQIVKS